MLTPQYNSNLSRTNDIFNHSNNHFWQYMQPGYDALDFISCTGTNFLVRANAYQVCVPLQALYLRWNQARSLAQIWPGSSRASKEGVFPG